ncbi:alpha-amylase [Martelella endophytica]|uniref:Cytoplasmic alpha-amylase n=1 Tax=Martelella endophytica TaxID=1486262 RepID=A0A0D5LQ40_MAREN|nr:alpha-amylase [Martelella endophytica]AJY46055.1 cytoplasmic alpha-amylase [Martelella endophytica]
MSGRVLLQFFHWYYPDGGKLWDEVAEKAESLATIGVTDVWLPPAYKGSSGGYSVGYDTYDLFDLGEFDQKGTVATKYGDRGALENACRTLADHGIGAIHDVVLNHKMGADEKERVKVRRANPENRTEIEDEAFEAEAYTRFTFPGRQGKYSKFIWTQKCFTGIDYLENPNETGVFRLVNEYGEGEWNDEVDQELGNYDYLIGADIEFRNRAVYEELKYWGRWFSEQVAVGGFRLDAAKHIPAWFFRDWIGHMREAVREDLFVVAEYWHPDIGALEAYLDLVDGQLTLFDVGLHHNFHDASKAGGDYDMRTIFDGAFVTAKPEHAVTLVENHDTQPLQSLEAAVEPWFKPLAYALILMREQGIPSVFYADLYGVEYRDSGDDGNEHDIVMPKIECLPKLIEARRRFANGAQTDIFDDPHCLAIVRQGTADAAGSVTVLTNGDEASKEIELGEAHAGATFRDFLGHREDTVTADENGKATFPVNAGSVSVWVREDSL